MIIITCPHCQREFSSRETEKIDWLHHAHHELLKMMTSAMNAEWDGTCVYCKEEFK